MVDALKDIADGGLVLPFAVYAVGIVDMAAAKGLDITDGTVKCEQVRHLFYRDHSIHNLSG